MKRFGVCAVVAILVANGAALLGGQPAEAKKVRLGNFSVSLTVKNLKASRDFYEKLGFRKISGNGRNWSIMQNETATIGLFQGMFEKNGLTFNPGWDRNSTTLKEFDDVRSLQQSLKKQGLKLSAEADESSTGPASFALFDPDGNPILVDQHVARPASEK